MSAHRESRKCPRCGNPLAGAELSGNCPRCLSALLLNSSSSEAFEAPARPTHRRLGDYELLEEIARGGMGIVFRARQVSLDRVVAIKLLRDSALARPEEVKRFRAEATSVARLKHPNIVAIHEVGEDGGQHFLAMDFIAGPNLAQCTTDGPLEPRRAAGLSARIADAVQHAHAQGVLHRDLKPSNVLMDTEGEVFVTDFGLARPLDTGSSLTMTGQVLGTPAFMSPEQAGGWNDPVGPAADVYSLGALLFHLLTGRPPFVSHSLAELMRQVSREEPLSPHLLNASVPPDLATICLKALAKRPAERYGSACEFANDLRRFLRHEPVLARPASRGERIVRWYRREPALAAALAFSLVALIVGGATATWQWRAAVVARRQAERATLEREEQLWQSLGQQAHFSRLSGQVGQRTQALAAIAAAAAIRPSLELRHDALAALMLPDLGPPTWWKEERSFLHPWCFDPTLEFYLPHVEVGHLTVRHASDHRILADLGEVSPQPSTATFSPDGRCLAVRLDNGILRAWDWRAGRLLADLPCSDRTWGMRPFDFSPDSRALFFGDATQGISRVHLDTGKITEVMSMAPPALVCVSPSGRRLAAARSRQVEVWDLDPPRLLSTTNLVNLPGVLVGMAWHPSEELLALRPIRGLSLWHWASGTILDFAESKFVAPNRPFFNAAGDLLFLGGGVWDVASQTQLLDLGANVGSAMALSRDERHIACQREKTGFGVWEFLSPVGTRMLFDHPLPPGARLPQPDVSADGQRLVTTHADGWRVWDTASGRVLARGAGRRANEEKHHARFTQDGQQVVTVDRNGVNRWPLPGLRDSNPAPPIVEVAPETLWTGISTAPPSGAETPELNQSPNSVAEHGCLTRGARWAALSGNGHVVVADLTGAKVSPAMRLLNNDVEFSLSPDGRWLATGRHNKPGPDVWDVRAGKPLLRIADPPFAACQFHPFTGELVAWSTAGMVFTEPPTGRMTRRFTWPEGSLISGLLPGGIAADGRTLWACASESHLFLLDGTTGQLVARWERPKGFWAAAVALDARGEHAYVTTARNVMVALDLFTVRRELARLGLDWPDAEPGRGFHRPPVPAKKDAIQSTIGTARADLLRWTRAP